MGLSAYCTYYDFGAVKRDGKRGMGRENQPNGRLEVPGVRGLGRKLWEITGFGGSWGERQEFEGILNLGIDKVRIR
jgi:hypothetical protein